jgi:hypothetical protein
MKNCVVVLSLFMSGCTFMNVQERGENRYEITSHGNMFHGRETLIKDIEEKAVKLCGAGNYEIVGNSGLDMTRYDVYHGGTTHTPSGANSLTRTVICKTSTDQ